jgi:hypothetical protein
VDNSIYDMLEAGELWTYSQATPAVAAAGTARIGILTGADKLIILSRSYESTGNALGIKLYKQTFTGGAAPSNAYNRNREFQAAQQPASVLAGVTFTPNTPEIIANVNAITSANNAQLAVDETEPLMLLANTSYVLELTNNDAQAETLSAAFTCRRRQSSERLR